MMVNIPNALTLLRAFGVPIFLYLLLIADQPSLAFLVIALGGLTDYLDGKIARALNQATEFGAKLDPIVDRLYITAVILALGSKDYLPWSLVIAILCRDLLLATVVLFQRLRGRKYLEVTFLGKAATFNLLYAFPLLLLSQVSVIGDAAFVIGWSFAIWGVTLYFYTGFQYLFSAIRTFR